MVDIQLLPQAAIEALVELRQRTRFFPLPEDGFDPLRASAEQLRAFGLPVPHDYPPGTTGYIARHRFLTGPEVGKPATFVAALSEEIGPPSRASLSSLITDLPWPAQKSSNWSGGYVMPLPSHRITSVMADWSVPSVAAPGIGGQPEYRSSTWIGLDGQRAYVDSTLPQIGTDQVWTTATGAATYGTWYQWWARGANLLPQRLNLPVDHGHIVSAMLVALDSSTVRFNIKNVTLGLILQAFDVTAPPQTIVAGATAEWIMERPSPIGYDGWSPFPLPHYQDFSFTACGAESKPPGNSTPQAIDLELARLIRMYEITQNPTAVRTISVATKVLQPSQRLNLRYTGP